MAHLKGSSESSRKLTLKDDLFAVASFEALKELLMSPKLLAYPDFNSPNPFIFNTDELKHEHEARQSEVVVTSRRARTTSAPHGTLNRAPPPYPTPSGVTPMSSVMPTTDSEAEMTSERTNLNVDPVGQPLSSARYPNIERFAFTPVPVWSFCPG